MSVKGIGFAGFSLNDSSRKAAHAFAALALSALLTMPASGAAADGGPVADFSGGGGVSVSHGGPGVSGGSEPSSGDGTAGNRSAAPAPPEGWDRPEPGNGGPASMNGPDAPDGRGDPSSE